MARGGLLLLGLVVASICVASAGRGPAEPGRKLVRAGDVQDVYSEEMGKIVQLTLVFDLTQVPKSMQGVRAKVLETALGVAAEAFKAVALVAGRANTVVKDVRMKLRSPAAVRVQMEMKGGKKEIVVDLSKAATMVVGDRETAVVVLVLDAAKHVLHLRDQAGQCLSVDLELVVVITV